MGSTARRQSIGVEFRSRVCQSIKSNISKSSLVIQETTEDSEVYVRTLADDPDDPDDLRPDDPDDPGGYNIRRRDAPFSTLEKSSRSVHIEAEKLLED